MMVRRFRSLVILFEIKATVKSHSTRAKGSLHKRICHNIGFLAGERNADSDFYVAVPVLHDVQHGAIVHTSLFGNKPFLFVGVSRQANSMVQIGAATKIQGPFDLVAVCKAKGMVDNKGSKDCIYSHIYPHLWASNVPKRELIVTWSESPPGGVLVAKLKFKIDEVAAVKEAKERKIAAEEREARRLAGIGEEREEAMDHFGYESDESNDPRPKRDRSEGRLKNGYVLTIPRTSSDPLAEP